MEDRRGEGPEGDTDRNNPKDSRGFGLFSFVKLNLNLLFALFQLQLSSKKKERKKEKKIVPK